MNHAAARPDHVVVGYSASMVADLDRRLAPDSVVLIEEPHVLAARGAADLASRSSCVAQVVAAPTQSLRPQDAHLVPRPAGAVCVLPAVEYAVAGAAVLAAAWRLPGAGVAAAEVRSDKTLLRQAAATGGLHQPRWAQVHDSDEVQRFMADRGGRCVLKPANRQASLGVQVLAPGDDIPQAWAHTVAADEPRLRAPGSFPTKFMVETFVAGEEYSVEMLLAAGDPVFGNVTGKQVVPGRFPVEAGHVVPAPTPVALQQLLIDQTSRLAAVVGFDTGVMHAEWMVAGGRAHLVECAGRLPGDSIDTLIGLAWGVDLLSTWIDLLRGNAATTPGRPERAAAIAFLQSRPGRVAGVTGCDAAAALPGVVEVDVSARVGEVVRPTTSSWDRTGYVVATGATPSQAWATADQARSLVVVATSDS